MTSVIKVLASPTKLVADDCAIYHQVSNTTDCITLQEDIRSFKTVHMDSKVAASIESQQIKVICISNKSKPPTHTYRMNNVTLEWINSFKYLGVRIDSKLKWGEHIEVTAKANRAMNLLSRTMYGCTKNANKGAYTALVRPHLEYCAPVWNGRL